MGPMPVPSLRELQEPLGHRLREQGGLGAILVDLAHLAQIERSFGGATYQSLRALIDPVILEMQDRFRHGDLLARDEREGDRYVLFLAARRDGNEPLSIPELGSLANRIEEFLKPRIARLSLPYLRERPDIDVGYAFVVFSPLEGEERQCLRLIEEARQSSELRRRVKEREQREHLIDIIYNRKVWTAFHAIVEMDSKKIVGYEGLSRGPRGSELQPPVALFGLAARHGLVEELERACRRQIFSDWEVFGAEGRLFVNTVPATVRDTSFMGRGVLDYLGPKLSPRFVTLEITEGQVIENLNLYREAMHAFLDLGFTFAIDDVGAGYSGLETIANLGASYLKIDMGLVRDVHQKRATQQVVKAILDVGSGVGATVIAEGIQTVAEADCLQELGVRYAQGYLYARPVDPHAPRTRVIAKNA